ncbi:hypothetical protein [Methylocella sp.]|uniref:hypothetical protein n=1 Tax=Methylocella sp. TaxID=1978226 RepID=UPI0037839BCC
MPNDIVPAAAPGLPEDAAVLAESSTISGPKSAVGFRSGRHVNFCDRLGVGEPMRRPKP